MGRRTLAALDIRRATGTMTDNTVMSIEQAGARPHLDRTIPD
jgi:hypothetical protein